ncbi:MAG: PQQ-dependent sugar dehydrogenase [Chloroflexota bacterium]
MRLIGVLTLVLCLGLAFAVVIPASAGAASPVAVQDVHINLNQLVASGFTQPVQLTNAGDGSGRLFVVEQIGRVRIIKNGAVLPAPFLDIASLISCCGERGLLGLAFHPNYSSNGYFYVDYTRAADGATVVARYSVSAGNPDLANPASATVLLVAPQPYSNHNAGQILFSPVDGYLYVALGDGGSGGDPLNSGQDTNTLLGSLLRLDVDGGAPYAIPPDNPFVGQPGADEIWAYGLRNPWRFSFDRLTGDLYIGDVGQNLWEEIDFQAAHTPGGTNFGWRCKEATHLYNFSGNCASQTLTDPIAEYDHTLGVSVTGGFVYRGRDYPALRGRYFYADFGSGRVWSLYQASQDPLLWSPPELELTSGLNISAFGEDENGELYVVAYNGEIRRLADANGPDAELSFSAKQVSTPGADPLEVVTYTIHITNTGALIDRPVWVTDTVPLGLAYLPGTLQASAGMVADAAQPQLTWQGNLSAAQHITISYQVQVTGVFTGSLVNHAVLSAPPLPTQDLYASLAVPRPALAATLQDFTFPGTQPGQLHAEIRTSADCDTCHSAPIYDRWRGSLMSQAGRDPLMWAALYVANSDAPNAGEFCLRCHTPKGWLEGHSQPADGSGLSPVDLDNGVACAVCHRMVDPLPSTQDEAAAIDQVVRDGLTHPLPAGLVGSAALIVDPDDHRRGPFSFGLALPYHSAYQTDFLRQTGDAITRARMCGSCHNVFNPVLSWDESRGQYWPNDMDASPPSYARDQLFPIETTFDEWLYSDFARGGVYAPEFAGSKPDGIVRTCQDCHMTRSTGYAADLAFNPVNRDCITTGCLPEHIFVGANAWVPQLLQDTRWRLNAWSQRGYLQETVLRAQAMLARSASLSVTLADAPGGKLATVRVANLTGHKLPTGYPEGRQMWLHVQAFDELGALIDESGAYNPLTGQLQRDAAIKVYEAKQGLTPELAALLPHQAGESFHFVLNNTVIKDNRIPPLGYTQALYDRPGLRPVGAVYLDGQNWDDTQYLLPPETVRVEVTLYYQTASSEYIDFLQKNGGVDGQALNELWQTSKSPPQVVAQAAASGYSYYLPLIPQNVPARTSAIPSLASTWAFPAMAAVLSLLVVMRRYWPR